MYVIKESQLNKFKDVKIPPASELMKTMQERVPVGHGDNSSDRLPDNLQGVDNLDRLMMMKRQIENEIAAFEAEQQQKESSIVEQPKEDAVE